MIGASIVRYNIYNCTALLCVQDAKNGERKQQLCGHGHRVVACAINKTREAVLSGSWDKTIKYWDPETCNCLVCIYSSS